MKKLKKRSEEHTSELQSHLNLVCRLLLEKKKQKKQSSTHPPRSTHKSPTAYTVRDPDTCNTRRDTPHRLHHTHTQHTLTLFFFFNDTATPEISPLPLPDALPI